MDNMEALVQRTLRTVFADDSIVYDKSRFAGGLTNYNYIMEIHGKTYVIRQPGVMTDRMLNRPVEQVNNVIAAGLGVNSVCIYFDQDTGIKISEYVDNAKTFAVLDPCAPECVRSVAALLKTLHASPRPFLNIFNWTEELLKYEQIVQEQNGQLFSDYPFLKKQLLAFIATHVASLEMLPCHNDTVPENFLMNTVTGRAYLIDWEYSGMNDPTWDIAAYIGESRLTRDAITALFSDYFGAAGPTAAELIKIKCFVMAQDLLWSVWAVIRHYSGEDYLDYCYNRYNRFRHDLKELCKDPNYPLSEMVKW